MSMFFMQLKSHISFINSCMKFYNCLFRKRCSFSEVTSGILIIGDEILKGTTDINSPYLIKQLNDINVTVAKVAIVPDNVGVIAKEVQEFSSKYSFVVTSGGIGPTHDDVTYEAVALACNDELHLDENLFKLALNYFGPECRNNPGVIKYATIPKSSVVIYVDISHNNMHLRYPVVSVKNIYMLPGIPNLLRKSFNQIKTGFTVKNKVIFTKEVFINIDEFSVTATLNQAVEKFQGNVKFGSYPTFTESCYKVKLVLESTHDNSIEEAYNFLAENFPKGSIVDIKNDTRVKR